MKDFLKITQSLTKSLQKHTPFEFNTEYKSAFKILKEKVVNAPVIVAPYCN